MSSFEPKLSIIIPVYNEAARISKLFRMLSEQRGVFFEIILCDGDSTDNTVDVAEKEAKSVFFPVYIVNGKKGRALQMNIGAKACRANMLLFLHADSFFKKTDALKNALDEMSETIEYLGHASVAGHFALCFDRSDLKPSFPYYYYESKARLGRKECIHGDQGLLIPNSFFKKTGCFDESFPILEDTRLAETIRKKGKWIIFKDEIFTSARRFEKEGMLERQTLNAIIMNFSSTQYCAKLLQMLSTVYCSQDKAERLELAPFFSKIQSLFDQLTFSERISLWYATGRYVCANAWQLVFVLDVKSNYRKNIAVGQGTTPRLTIFDQYCEPLMRNFLCNFITAGLVWVWFNTSRIWYTGCYKINSMRKNW